jgi:hypothetical protein
LEAGTSSSSRDSSHDGSSSSDTVELAETAARLSFAALQHVPEASPKVRCCIWSLTAAAAVVGHVCSVVDECTSSRPWGMYIAP